MYAVRAFTARCHGVPIETLGSVMRLDFAKDWNDLHQSAQAEAPCHACGGISSMMPADGAQVAIQPFISLRLNAARALLKTAMTAEFSDAVARSASVGEKIAIATSATVHRKVFIQ